MWFRASWLAADKFFFMLSIHHFVLENKLLPHLYISMCECWFRIASNSVKWLELLAKDVHDKSRQWRSCEVSFETVRLTKWPCKTMVQKAYTSQRRSSRVTGITKNTHWLNITNAIASIRIQWWEFFRELFTYWQQKRHSLSERKIVWYICRKGNVTL